jgi:uncharacterized protein
MRKPFLWTTAALAVASLAGALTAAGGGWSANAQNTGTKPMSIPEMAQQMFTQPEVAALATAAATGQVAEVQRLLDAGVAVNGRGASGFTPLGYALVRQNLVGAEALLKRGADPNFGLEDKKFKTPYPFMLVIAERGSADMLALLLRYGGNANTRLPVRLDAKPDQQYEGDAILTSVVTDLAKAKALVEHGADINYVPHPDSASIGNAAAIVSAARLARLEVVDYLLDHGAIDFDEVAGALQGRPWSEDLKPHRLAILKRLREKGAKIYAGYRPLLSEKIQMYTPQDTPAEWITPGYLDMREVWKNYLQRWEAQQRKPSKQ